MMDIEKLIEAVRLCGSTPKVHQCKQCAYWAGGDMSRCIPNMTGDAATALSTLMGCCCGLVGGDKWSGYTAYSCIDCLHYTPIIGKE